MNASWHLSRLCNGGVLSSCAHGPMPGLQVLSTSIRASSMCSTAATVNMSAFQWRTQQPELQPRLQRPTAACHMSALTFHSAVTSPSAHPQPAAQQEADRLHSMHVDAVGAVSLVVDDLLGGTAREEGFRNADGFRVDDGRYAAFAAEVSRFIPAERQFSDPLRTFAYGNDASFYRLERRSRERPKVLLFAIALICYGFADCRLNPKLVVKVHTEDEMGRILPIAAKHGVPVTFRCNHQTNKYVFGSGLLCTAS